MDIMRKLNITTATFFLSALTLCFGSWTARAEWMGGDVKVSTGFDYSSGDYGDIDDTEIIYLPLTVKYQKFPWTIKSTFPLISIKGPGGVVGGGAGGGVVVDQNVQTEDEFGFGDLVTSAVYSIDPWSENAPIVDLEAKIKFPTAAKDKNLGTGEFDYTFQVEFAKKAGRFFPFASIGYQFLGDPDGEELNDRILVAVGTDYKVSPPASVGIIYDYKKASTDNSDDPSELTAYLNWRANETWSVNTYTYTGFSDGSPDWGIGTQITCRR